MDSIWYGDEASSGAWALVLAAAIEGYEYAPMGTTAYYFSVRYSDLPEEVKEAFWRWIEVRFQTVDDLSTPLSYWYWENLSVVAPDYVKAAFEQHDWPDAAST
jgi:hypothetical protein